MVQVLVFRAGAWVTVDVPTTDPALGEVHHRRMAAAAATAMTRGVKPAAAMAAAEAEIYDEVFAAAPRNPSGTA